MKGEKKCKSTIKTMPIESHSHSVPQMTSVSSREVTTERSAPKRHSVAPREKTVVDPDTHARHMYGQTGNTKYYQYTYDSRDDPRFKKDNATRHVHAQRVFVSGSTASPLAPPASRLYGSNGVRIEDATDEVGDVMSPVFTRTSQHHARAPFAGAPSRVSTVPVVEEPDDDDDEAGVALSPAADTRRQPRPRRSAAMGSHPEIMLDPFVEMNRMHAAMMQNMMAPTMFSVRHGVLRDPFEDDTLLFQGLGVPTLHDTIFGYSRPNQWY